MGRVVYFLRVLFISFEALTLCVLAYAATSYSQELQSLASSVSMNDEMMKYLMLLPAGLAVWVLNELRQLVFEDEKTAKLLIKWPEYWKLKCHIWVALIYTFLFSAASSIPWLSKTGISTGSGIALFASCIVGQLIVAMSVYSARFSVREITIDAK
jgi:hypothetical protein